MSEFEFVSQASFLNQLYGSSRKKACNSIKANCRQRLVCSLYERNTFGIKKSGYRIVRLDAQKNPDNP